MKMKCVEHVLYEAMRKVKVKDMLQPIIDDVDSECRLHFLIWKSDGKNLNFSKDLTKRKIENKGFAGNISSDSGRNRGSIWGVTLV